MSDYNLDDLLDLLEETDEKKKTTKVAPSVIRFVGEYEIEEGTEKVPTQIIYYYYKKVWDGAGKNNKCSKIEFFRSFNKLFKQKRTKRQRYYLLNDKITNTKEAQQEAIEYEAHYIRNNSGTRKKEKSKVRTIKKKL